MTPCHPWRDRNNAEHDMVEGPCACGGWHETPEFLAMLSSVMLSPQDVGFGYCNTELPLRDEEKP